MVVVVVARYSRERSSLMLECRRRFHLPDFEGKGDSLAKKVPRPREASGRTSIALPRWASPSQGPRHHPVSTGPNIALAQISTTPVQAADYDVGSIHITAPWARATPKGASSGAPGTHAGDGHDGMMHMDKHTSTDRSGRPPAGETVSPRFLSSLAIRTCPNAG
jgi:hypothetical protein